MKFVRSAQKKCIATLALTLTLIPGLNYPVVSPGFAKTAGEPTGQTSVAPRNPYAAAVEMLERFIAHEMADKDLPALSIALVDDQQIVWAKGFGYADPQSKTPATAERGRRVSRAGFGRTHPA